MSARQFNRDCHCVVTDVARLKESLEVTDTHAHLFSASPVFVTEEHVGNMRELVAAVDRTCQLEAFQALALSAADPIARVPTPLRGAFLGFDFHITTDGPRLIEINTNAGGALLNIAARRAQQQCCPGMVHAGDGTATPEALEARIVQMMRHEWRLARGEEPLRTLAIVDDDPESQFLYPEFRLFRDLLDRHGVQTKIADPSQLELHDGALVCDDARIDMVYNRLTDFYWTEPRHSILRRAQAIGTVITPHPRAHALFANKQNLAWLSDAETLRRLQVPAEDLATLIRCIPPTRNVSGDGEGWWADRKRWFFKPAVGYGSRGAYRGDKLTRRVFNEILLDRYVAQEWAPPAERFAAANAEPLKTDIRCYVYAGEIQLIAARLYRGQTTNFRTPGGGFAPVYTVPPSAGSTNANVAPVANAASDTP